MKHFVISFPESEAFWWVWLSLIVKKWYYISQSHYDWYACLLFYFLPLKKMAIATWSLCIFVACTIYKLWVDISAWKGLLGWAWSPIRSPEIFLILSPFSGDEKKRRNDKLTGQVLGTIVALCRGMYLLTRGYPKGYSQT